ncbi:MAG: hypothetical protein COA73_10790 [Candidatus Hydrogenedentota bacterium]|nr:MAG: hypothetical protein COA73_10790 [Candidatus Hydrogenedentota bacterium]
MFCSRSGMIDSTSFHILYFSFAFYITNSMSNFLIRLIQWVPKRIVTETDYVFNFQLSKLIKTV